MALGNIDDTTILQNGSLQQQLLSPPRRTYIKVGSLGRHIDVTRFKNYDDLRSAMAYMFGLYEMLGGPSGSSWEMLGGPSGSRWKLVYVDYETDMLLVGDIPWEEFVSFVSCIRIVSPSEVQQFWEGEILLVYPRFNKNTDELQ